MERLTYPGMKADLELCRQLLLKICSGERRAVEMNIPPQQIDFDLQFSAAFKELQAYRNTGLEPDEIPHWIPVSEPPKVSGEYLVLLENGDMFNATFDKDSGDDGEFGIWQDRYDEHTMGFLDSEWSSYDGITHWMPLPQPPKEAK